MSLCPHGWEAMYPSTRLEGATKMTISDVAKKATGAVGMYQNLPRYLIDRANAVGFGATCTIIPLASGSAVAGIQTAGLFGGAGATNIVTTGITTVTLSPAKAAVDFISFFIHYNGGTNTDLKSYKVYVTKNGGFGFGTAGI